MPWYIWIPATIAAAWAIKRMAEPHLLRAWANRYWESLTDPERLELLEAWLGSEIKEKLCAERPSDFPEDVLGKWADYRTSQAEYVAKSLPQLRTLSAADKKKIFIRFTTNCYRRCRKHDLDYESVIFEIQDIEKDIEVLSAYYRAHSQK